MHGNIIVNELNNEKMELYSFFGDSLISLKHHYYYLPIHNSARTFISNLLNNYEADSTLRTVFINIESVQMENLRYLHTTPALNPRQISYTFFDKILSGNTPILNFTCVRNPFTRIGTWISKYNGTNNLKFLKKSIKTRNMHLCPLSEYNKINFDYIIRFENLEQDICTLFPRFKGINMQSRNPTPPQEYISFLEKNQDIKEFIIEFYKEDFIKFGYSFDLNDINDYDNSVIPRSLDKWKNPEKYPCDISNLAGDEYESMNRIRSHLGDTYAKIMDALKNNYKINIEKPE